MENHFLPFLLLFFLSISSATRLVDVGHKPRSADTESKHFVLVHGACLGGWSWYKVSEILVSLGHNVSALDMAASGIDMKEADSLTTLTEYFQPLLDFMEALPSEEKIILVGHSLGGLGISMAMERFPQKISVSIFVTAAMPGPLFGFLEFETQKSILEMFTRFIEDYESLGSSKLFIFSEKEIETKLFPLSPHEDVTLAKTLMRPQRMFGMIKSMEELGLTREKYGSVKRVYVISEKDKMTPKILVVLMLLFNKPDQVTEIKGSDHMVMTSQPLDLADQLQSLAHNFTTLADI